MSHRDEIPDDLRSDPDVPEDVRYDPDLAVHEPMQVPTEPLRPSRRRSPLLVIPLVVLALSLLVVLLFGWLARETRTSADYVGTIRQMRPEAWQTAFELSRRLADENPHQRGPLLVPDLIAAFRDADGRDPRLRRYLTLSLAHLKDPRTRDALLGALRDDDLETRLYALWGLGGLGDATTAPDLIPVLQSDDADLRKAAAYALGATGGAAAAAALRTALNDSVADVAWNAALALARLGDPSGAQVIARMLDRNYLENVSRIDADGVRRPMSEVQVEEALVGALRGAALLGEHAPTGRMRALRRGDSSLRVRQAAREALEKLQGDGTQ